MGKIYKLDISGETIVQAEWRDIQDWLPKWPVSALRSCDSLMVRFEHNGDLIDMNHYGKCCTLMPHYLYCPQLSSNELSGFVDYMKERYEYDAFITI